MPNTVDSEAVFQWPEFRAFAGRLGIDLMAATTYLRIELAIDSLPKIQHEFNGSDEGPAMEEKSDA